MTDLPGWDETGTVLNPEVFATSWRENFESHDKSIPGSEESRRAWNEKAPSFAKKPERSGYIAQLLKLLDLKSGESVFDMGCGSGTLAIPLALAGHNIVAVDFSDGMLAELESSVASQEGTEGRIRTFQRSWQESWDGLPQADVAVSSRSFINKDLADGIAKLESKARKRVVVTTGAGDLPYRDIELFRIMGRDPIAMQPAELACLVGYLFSIGRLPKVAYIEYPGVSYRSDRDELKEALIKAHMPETPEQETALSEYLDEHIVFDEERGRWRLDHDRKDSWACVTWDVP